MKLDIPLDIWYAWQEGNKSKLEHLLIKFFTGPCSATIPSVAWGYQTTSDYKFIIDVIMISNKWTAFKFRDVISSYSWRFERNRLPYSDTAALPYRDFIIVSN